MRTASITGTVNLTVRYPDKIAFMYSRLPVIVTAPSVLKRVGVKVTLPGQQRSYTEYRTPNSTVTEFDISRIVQILMPDVDILSESLAGSRCPALYETVSLDILYQRSSDTADITASVGDFNAMYGALDQGEVYGAPAHRRLWVNFPQTFTVWANEQGGAYIYCQYNKTDGPIDITLPNSGECLLLPTIRISAGTDVANAFISAPKVDLITSWDVQIKEGSATTKAERVLTLIMDHSKPSDGTYLRWLNRQGGFSYWLFLNSKLRTTSAMDETFTRRYSGDPAAPSSLIYRNPQKASYRESREMVLGAVGLRAEEYEDLCSLATSPLVERYIPTETGSERWQRVNVAAGTFERNIRRSTPSLQDLEIVIELPERNTVKL